MVLGSMGLMMGVAVCKRGRAVGTVSFIANIQVVVVAQIAPDRWFATLLLPREGCAALAVRPGWCPCRLCAGDDCGVCW